jgi:hypothetical protein
MLTDCLSAPFFPSHSGRAIGSKGMCKSETSDVTALTPPILANNHLHIHY